MKIISKYLYSECIDSVDRALPRADFTFSLDKIKRRLTMIDIGHGTMSLTNDMERVLTYIAGKYKVHLDEYEISYLDSMNMRNKISITEYDPRDYVVKTIKFR